MTNTIKWTEDDTEFWARQIFLLTPAEAAVLLALEDEKHKNKSSKNSISESY